MNKKFIYVGLGIVIVVIGAVFLTQNKSPYDTSQASKLVETIDLKDGDTYDLTASYVTKVVAGKEQRMLAYNGMIPGPTIRVQQGANITIKFKNDTDLPALLHSHGVRMDNAFDGSQAVQKDIPPGGSFSYQLKFP